MLETPDYPTLARVMRVQSEDYADPVTEEDKDDDGAEGDDDDGWGVVPVKSRNSGSVFLSISRASDLKLTFPTSLLRTLRILFFPVESTSESPRINNKTQTPKRGQALRGKGREGR